MTFFFILIKRYYILKKKNMFLVLCYKIIKYNDQRFELILINYLKKKKNI
jgi:hypothetical protein